MLATLGCAPIVCRGHGTFRNSYENQNTFHTKKLVGDGSELTNFTKAWKNTAQARSNETRYFIIGAGNNHGGSVNAYFQASWFNVEPGTSDVQPEGSG